MINYYLIITFLVIQGQIASTSYISRSIPSFSSISVNITFCSTDIKNLTIQVQTQAISTSLISSTIIKQFFNFQKSYIEFQIWNFQQIQMSCILKVYGNQNNNEICYFAQINSKKNPNNPLNLQAFSVLYKSTIQNYVLPFNFLNQKNLKIFVNFQKTLNQPNSYQNPPFLNTFWNQNSPTTLVLPWLPYFSQCNNTKQRIFLISLLTTKNCIINLNSYMQKSIVCQDKQQIFKCLLEQNQIVNSQNDAWFKSLDKNLFYLYPVVDSASKLEYYYSDSTLNSYLSLNQKELISINYINNVALHATPKQFVFNLYLGQNFVENQFKFEIAYCQLIANQILSNEKTQQLLQNQAFVKINVFYLNIWQRFIYLNLSVYYYLVLFVFLIIIWKLSTFLLSLKSTFTLYKNKSFVLLIPILKGLFYSSITMLAFGIGCYELSCNSNFSFVGSSFDGDESTQILLQKYKGRNGVTLAICGIYCLLHSISQTQKVVTPQQAKQLIDDDIDQKKSKQYNQDQNQEKSIFLIKNLQSKRKYSALLILIQILLILYMYYTFLKCQKVAVFLIILILPLIEIFHHLVFRFIFNGQFLHSMALKIAIQSFIFLNILSSKTIWQLFSLYFFISIQVIILTPISQLLIYKVCEKISNDKEPNLICLFLLNHLKVQIFQISKESQYQRALKLGGYFCSNLCLVFFRPILLLFSMFTIKDTRIYSDFIISENKFYNIIGIIIIFAFFQWIFLNWVINLYENVFRIKIMEVIKFNNFKFKCRKIRWLSDQFVNSSSITSYYRSFQKFNFSSQLFLVLYEIAISIALLTIGLKIIIQHNYIMFTDPALIIISPIIWVLGTILSTINSFIILKLKLYEIKQQNKNRTKLLHLQKLIKVQNYQPFLKIEAVKNFFLIYNKQWIVKNLNKILLKEHFLENKGELIHKYKLYQNFLKKKNRSTGQKETNFAKIQRVSNTREKLKYQIIKLSEKSLQNCAKPAFMFWFYAAKQKIFLKNIVESLKNIKKKQICQFCSIDFDLQSIEKRQFSDIYNEFRVINVGKCFVQSDFFQFYRQKQDFITICSECFSKRLYLEKTTIKNSGNAKKITLAWHLKAKSSLLHKKNNKNKFTTKKQSFQIVVFDEDNY